MTGSAGRRTNGIFDITVLAMILLAYTISQTDRDLKHWNSIQSRNAATLDLRLKDPKDFFDPIQVGPKMAINQEYASTIRRYISAMRVPAPLRIHLLCSEPVAENVQDMMREVLRMHYEEEEDSIVKVLESRYRRIMSLIMVSVFVIGIIRQTSVISEEIVYEVASVEGAEHVIESGKDTVITVKRSVGDEQTYSLYAGAKMDGTDLPEGSSSAAPGSLVLTLKAAYLDTLKEGKHVVGIAFEDGEAEAAVTIVAKPAPEPTETPSPTPTVTPTPTPTPAPTAAPTEKPTPTPLKETRPGARSPGFFRSCAAPRVTHGRLNVTAEGAGGCQGSLHAGTLCPWSR